LSLACRTVRTFSNRTGEMYAATAMASVTETRSGHAYRRLPAAVHCVLPFLFSRAHTRGARVLHASSDLLWKLGAKCPLIDTAIGNRENDIRISRITHANGLGRLLRPGFSTPVSASDHLIDASSPRNRRTQIGKSNGTPAGDELLRPRLGL
jgi:hypothetical protein